MSEKHIYIAPDGKQYRLTHDEARDMGFCPACGEFVAGSEPDGTIRDTTTGEVLHVPPRSTAFQQKLPLDRESA